MTEVLLFKKILLLIEDSSSLFDRDNRYRTGGSVEEITEEAHLSPQCILDGIRKFASERPERLRRLKSLLPV